MDKKSLLVLLRHVAIKTFERGETLIEKGAKKKDLLFVRKGLVRSYFTTENGDEVTFQLFSEFSFLGNVYSILFDEPSKLSFHALEHTKVYTIDYVSFQDLIAKNPILLGLGKFDLGKWGMQQAFMRVEAFVLLSPEERYLKYMNDYPDIINRAPDKYIANVLGITPVSLSRIKGRIAAKR